MTKRFLIIAAAAGCLFAAAPAQAFWGDKTGVGKRFSDMVYGHKKRNTPRGRYERQYGASFRHGFPPDCAQDRERAYLTDNAYWNYAAKSCRFSYYSYH
jgi:hypothetical protein